MIRPPLRPAFRRLSVRLAGLALLCCAGLAQAQFVWIAPNGTRQYSDQPPPPGTPPSKILKAPGRAPISVALPPAAEPAAAPAAAPAAEPAAARARPPTLAEREADYRKRMAQRDEAERKLAAEAQNAAAQAAYCKEMRKSKRMTESGVRISEVGEDGQKRFITDSERAQRAASIDKALAGCR
ncbi:DUF4124 domain-containing protein [Massilia sp. GCM10023247]|uniref:DUF4124 domain-containing protein n=1 Tax=Massilia sp. GCM10023247 TaxID=3252643 RepID=UPI003620EA08